MDFPHVEPDTDQRFARLYPLVSQNEQLKAAAKDAPDMLKFSREGGEAHYKLYESRIPPSVDADAVFAPFASDAAREASIAEGAAKRAAKESVDRVQRSTAAEAYPEEVRYYPAIAEGNRERFNQAVKDAGLSTKSVQLDGGGTKPADVSYMPSIKAFVSKVGPVPSLAEWQTPEAKAMWDAEGERLQKQQRKGVDRAAEAVEATALRAEGKHFLADNLTGLILPPAKNAEERAAVVASIGAASLEDLKKVQQITEESHKALSRRQYAIQIKAAQQKDPNLSAEKFNAMNDKQRRVAAGYNELSNEDFLKMVGLQYGKMAIVNELKARGEHMSVEEARDKKERAGTEVEKKTSVDEKSKSREPDAEPEQAAEKPAGRAGNRGAQHAAALAATLQKGR